MAEDDQRVDAPHGWVVPGPDDGLGHRPQVYLEARRAGSSDVSRRDFAREFTSPSHFCLGDSLRPAQLCLGFLAFITRVMWGRDAAQPELPMVVATVIHVAVGAMLLATTVILAIQVWRHVPVPFEERVPGQDQDPVAA